MQVKIPMQYTPTGRLVKRFLHTKLGCRVGFMLGLSGYNTIVATIKRANGKIEVIKSFNSRVDKGADLCASLMTGVAQNSISSPLPPKYIALSTSSLTPAHGDTTLTGETAASGLARALGTQTYTTTTTLDAAASYVVSKTFTNTSAGAVTIVSAALFDAVSSGNLFVEGNLSSSVVLAVNDQITINWTVNL